MIGARDFSAKAKEGREFAAAAKHGDSVAFRILRAQSVIVNLKRDFHFTLIHCNRRANAENRFSSTDFERKPVESGGPLSNGCHGQAVVLL